MLFGFAGGRLCERWSEEGTLVVGLVMCLTGAGGLLATAVFGLPVIAVILSLFTMVGGVAAITPPTTSLAMANYPDIAGTASSLLGLARFGIGGLAAPLVGLGGSHDALPLGLVTVTATLLAGFVYVATIRGRTSTPDTAPSSVDVLSA
jgi:DHA1 family bicyclomycin/chloramphenicol resistance-like MFS transporter